MQKPCSLIIVNSASNVLAVKPMLPVYWEVESLLSLESIFAFVAVDVWLPCSILVAAVLEGSVLSSEGMLTDVAM